MLTSDLVQVRRKGELIEPRWLDAARRARLAETAAAFIAVAAGGVGLTRDELEPRWQAVPASVRDRVAAAGLRKLVDDRCTWEGGDEAAAQALRAEVFTAAASARSELGPGQRFDREAVMSSSALARGASIEDLERGLFADLRGAERLVAFDPIASPELFDLYDLGLAQAVLLRATRVVVEIRGEGPERLRRLFRAASFHGLLHVVRPRGDGGVSVELDGPMSLFESVQRYGLRLAVFLPHVLSCRDFSLRADLSWGHAREARRFELDALDGIAAGRADPLPAVRPEVAALLDAWPALGTPWTARPCDRVIALPGEVVVAPDVVFEDPRTGEEVFLEVFGFWSRAAVFARVEQVRRGLGGRMILAVGKHLRVSEELLGEEDAGEIHVFKTTLSARAILQRLEKRP